MGRPSALREAATEKRMHDQAIVEAAEHGPLQSLTDRELEVRHQPLTIYPWNAQRRVRAWVRFGPESVRLDARIVRSTALAAGKGDFEAVDGTVYRRAAPIPLTGGCVGCHTGFFKDPPKSPRFAGLIISMPVSDPSTAAEDKAPR